MEKIKVKSIVENKYEIAEYTSFGIINGDEIKYEEDGTEVTINLFENSVTMIREQEELLITFNFILNETTNGKYYIYNPKMELGLEVKTTFLEMIDNVINIVYELKLNGQDMGLYKFNLEYEVIN